MRQVSATENIAYDYTRSGNPTRDALEKLLADVEGAHHAFAFSTRMAALAAATRLVTTGCAIVAGNDIYGGTDRLLSRVVPRAGVAVRWPASRHNTTGLEAVRAAVQPATKLVVMESLASPTPVHFSLYSPSLLFPLSSLLLSLSLSVLSPTRRVDTSDLEAVRAEVGEDTKLVVMESPTNPRMMISNIRAIANIAHLVGAVLVVDNSIMSPVLSRPLQLGADIVILSGTKFISGHSDVMSGIVAVNDPE
ncbi:unnamed protein product [Closterium sp. NIES-65]|nr:unnamed protein product [Closterium sp. NIES-65]